MVGASRSALLELALSLRSYGAALVLVGGWVPYFLLRDHGDPSSDFEHVGSIDIDIVVDPSRVGAIEYASIVKIIADRGWTHHGHQVFSYHKSVPSPLDGVHRDIRVDFLTTEPERLVGSRPFLEVQPDLLAVSMRAAPLAISHRTEVLIGGTLPDGGEARMELLMSDVVGCVGMKGIALGSRYVEKDSYDIYTVLENYGEGPREVGRAVRPHVDEPLMTEAIENIREMFRTRKAVGPVSVANFHVTERGEVRERRITRAYEIVKEFLGSLG